MKKKRRPLSNIKRVAKWERELAYSVCGAKRDISSTNKRRLPKNIFRENVRRIF
jgi:hypothetical protein